MQALGPLDQFEFHGLAFIQGAVTLSLDRAKVHKNVVVTFFASNETKSLGVVEPLYRCLLYTSDAADD